MPIRNAPAALPTTLRFMGSRLARRLRGGGKEPAAAELRARVERVVGGLGDRVRRCDFVTVPARPDPWLASGVALEAGDAVTLLAEGRIYLSRALDVGFGPDVGLWYRVGDGEIGKIVGRASTLRAERAGALFLTSKPPGEFADRRGRFEADPPRTPMPGEFTVAAIQWRGDPGDGLAAAASLDGELFGPGLRRSREPLVPPPGWHYLWRLGESEIYTQSAEDGSLDCRTSCDASILQFPVRRALTPETRLRWSWRVEELPSRFPEHVQPTHDYLSIAVEFDDGRDLTYLWSAALPVGTIFQCPLPWWDRRETHWVVRRGGRELGRFVDERRDLLADCERALGGDPPREVVAVWLIAVSVFQRGEGRCRYRGIALEDGGGELVVHP
jgi:hypothetical protein